jgi:hypothetical protein
MKVRLRPSEIKASYEATQRSQKYNATHPKSRQVHRNIERRDVLSALTETNPQLDRAIRRSLVFARRKNGSVLHRRGYTEGDSRLPIS